VYNPISMVRGAKMGGIKRVLTDVQFLIPLAVLLIGIVLLVQLH
jgi:hypothetical protein